MILLLLSLQGAFAQQPPPPPPPEEEPPPLVKDPVLLEFVQAPYPPAAQAEGVQGSVLLAIEIDETGAARTVEVIRSAGYGFDEAAVEAAKLFRFSPAEDASGPVPVIIEFEYGFLLDSSTRSDAVPQEVVEEAPVEQPVNLEGQVVEMGTRRPLADITLRLEPSGLETITDANGRYQLRGVPVGQTKVRIVHPGFQQMEETITLTEGQVTEAKLWLRNLSYGTAGVIGAYQREKVEVTQRSISIEEIRRIPGTFGDPVRVVQSLPGAARSPFGTGLLIIRGSNPQDSGVYVDGIRIPLIYHLGGFESVINPDLVAGVDYLPGGFGVQYGRSTGGVVDVTTKGKFPDRPHISWSTDILDSGGTFTASLGKKKQHGIGVAARRSYIDALLPLFTANTGFVAKPRWYDYQAKYIYQGDAPIQFSALAFGFEDVLFASTPPGFSQGTDQDGQGDLGTRYSTHRILVNLEVPITDSLHFRFTPSFGNDYGEFKLGNEWKASNSQWIAEVRAELPWEPSEHFRLVPGVDFLGGWSDFEIILPFDPSSFASTDPLAEREPFSVAETQPGWGPDAYLMAQIRPLKDPEALLISPGLRFNYINITGELTQISFDPRLSARWAVQERTRLKGSVGLYSQPPQPFQAFRPDDEMVELKPEKSLSGTIGVEHDFSQVIHADVEFFYKWMYDLIVGNPNFQSLDTQFFVNSGVGRAYGMEVLLRHDPVGPLFGWISYTLSRSERKDDPDDDRYYLFDYDQTHILSAVAGYKLPLDFEISAKAQYVTGNPTTTYGLGVYDVDLDTYNAFSTSEYNDRRLPAYGSVSLRLDKLFTFKTWQLDLYVDVLNVIRGKNPEFQIYNYDYTESDYVRGLPTIPGPGFEIKADF